MTRGSDWEEGWTWLVSSPGKMPGEERTRGDTSPALTSQEAGRGAGGGWTGDRCLRQERAFPTGS